MCGIVGSFRSDGLTEPEIQGTRNLTELMKHRGPDGEGFWTDHQFCALGFRRLSILDLTLAANQPMKTSDGRYHLLYNGEVYNFQDLRNKLKAKGIQFQSTGDTEVVLYALATWGVEALQQFNGMFALAFYDSAEKVLTLARDYAGMKPLYYISSHGRFAFASQYDQILAHPWSSGSSISPDALALYLRFAYIPAPYALLENTHLLEPGSWLRVSKQGAISTGKFFEFPKYIESELRDSEASEAVDAAVTHAVRRHLVSDVPVGAFLSGGIDSPLIVGKMREWMDPFPTFTMGILDNQRDESKEAAIYAKEFCVENTMERMTPEIAKGLLQEMIAACGEPFADYSILPTLMICRLAKKKVKVLLSGDGGDELFWGYWPRFSAVLNGLSRYRKPRWPKRLYTPLSRTTKAPLLPTVGDWYRKIHQRIPEKWFRNIFSDLTYPEHFHLFDFSETAENKDRTAQWMRWNEYRGFLSMVLMKVDRASMHNSLEVRIPLLDREVLDVAMKIGWTSCMDMDAQLGKLPLRNALGRHTKSQSQTKKGFTIPLNQWFRNGFKSLFEETLFDRNEILGYKWKQEAVRSYFNSHASGQEDHAWGLWVLMNLALWQDKYM